MPHLLSLVVATIAPASGCFTAARDVPAGAAITAADLAAAECRVDVPRAKLRYDRRGSAVVAADAIPAGTYLGRVAPLRRTSVAKGSELVLRAAAGPVVIERRVTAMQPGRAGGRIFVRDADGQVFAVPVAEEAK